MPHADFVHLHLHTQYSLLDGACQLDRLMAKAKEYRMPALAVTDRDGVHGIPSAHVVLREKPGGPRLIVGSEITLDDDSTLVLIAADQPGYRNLCRLISRGRLRCAKGESHVGWAEVAEHAVGLIALWGGARGRITQGKALPRDVATMLRA